MKQLGLVPFSECEKVFNLNQKSGLSIGLLCKDNLWIFRYRSFYNKEDVVHTIDNQLELSRTAIEWFLSTLRVEFSLAPSQGGLPTNVLHCTKIIDDEQIDVRRSMNCYEEGQRGYTLRNNSRSGYNGDNFLQHMQLPDFLLFDDGMISALEEMLVKYPD